MNEKELNDMNGIKNHWVVSGFVGKNNNFPMHLLLQT